MDVAINKVLSKIKSKTLFRLYKWGLVGHDTIYGKTYFEKMDREEALDDAQRFASVVESCFSPKSVIELGCGTGRLLYPYFRNGIDNVHGVDVSESAKKVSQLPKEKFEIHDLTKPYSPPRQFDVVLCIEVLEHIPEHSTDTIVGSVCKCASLAIVTAAPPGQGGTHHVNEQSKKYWINKFESYGMSYKKVTSKRFKQKLHMTELVWIPKNIMIFESS